MYWTSFGGRSRFCTYKDTGPEWTNPPFFYQAEQISVQASEEENANYLSYWEQLPEFLVGAFEYANEHFGLILIRNTPLGRRWGIPNGNTDYGSSFTRQSGVSVHEMYHSWYQNVIATNEALYAWIDEGFTVYASNETMDHLFGKNRYFHEGSYNGYYALARSGVEEPMSTHADHFHNFVAPLQQRRRLRSARLYYRSCKFSPCH